MVKELMLNISIRKEPEGGYSVICTDLDVASQGETIEEATENIKEAVELYIESAEEIGIMNEVLEKLGLTQEDIEKEEITISKVFRTEIPIKLTIEQ